MKSPMSHYRPLLLGAVLVTVPAFAVAQSADTPADDSADSLTEMFTKGSTHGTFGVLSYSTHNAYFAKGYHQDTTSYGGYANFYSAPYLGFSFGVGGYVQRGIHRDHDHLVGELGNNQTNIGEAWLRWQGAGFAITAGNQRLNLPFASTEDWRITPNLFQAIDIKYGDADNYLEATKVFRYKTWGAGRFSKTTMYNVDGTVDPDETTSGMWSVGGHGTYHTEGVVWTGDAWHQSYKDYANLDYFQGKGQLERDGVRPFLAVQMLRGHSNGKTLTARYSNDPEERDAQSHIYGLQTGFDYHSFNLSLGYDHITSHRQGHMRGALVTPYAHNMMSGPLFAQPYFTSTQDLGAGNAYQISASNAFDDGKLIVGAQYSFMDLVGYNSGDAQYTGKSLNQSEYMGYFIYNFSGALTGFSIGDWFGLQVAQRPDVNHTNFWQNRLAVQYSF